MELSLVPGKNNSGSIKPTHMGQGLISTASSNDTERSEEPAVEDSMYKRRADSSKNIRLDSKQTQERVSANCFVTPSWMQTRKKHSEMSFKFHRRATLWPNPVSKHRHISRVATVVMIEPSELTILS